MFEVGDRVRVQDVKRKTWNMKGTIVSVVFHEGAKTPSSYYIAADEGGEFLRNGKYIRLLEEQACTQKEDSDYQAADLDKGPLGDENVDESEGRVHRHTRKQVQFREQAKSTDKVPPVSQVQFRGKRVKTTNM